MARGLLHHVEYYVSDLEESVSFWKWFLESLGYSLLTDFGDGVSYQLGDTYLVFVQCAEEYKDVKNNRQGPGLNHLAFHIESPEELETYASELEGHGAKVLKVNDFHVCFEAPDAICVELFLND